MQNKLKDFEDWYCSVIETTCKKCCTEQYAECQIRGILTKYGVYPIDPTAVGKCQFSYIGTPEAEDLQPFDDCETVPAEVYNMAVNELAALKLNLNAEYLPQIASLKEMLNHSEQEYKALDEQLDRTEDQLSAAKNEIESHKDVIKDLNSQLYQWDKQYAELEAILAQKEEKLKAALGDNAEQTKKWLDKIDERDKEISQLQEQLQTAAAAQEQPKEEYPVNIGLASGGEFDYVLPAHMAEIMIHEIQRPRHSRGTCAQYVGGSLVAIDLQEVIALHVDKLPPKDWVKPKEAQAAPGQQEIYRVECKCGAEYYAEMNAGRTKAWCRECKTAVFADRSAEVSTADGAAATLLTNRYWVERERPAEQRKEIPALKISDNFGKEYKDPINPLA